MLYSAICSNIVSLFEKNSTFWCILLLEERYTVMFVFQLDTHFCHLIYLHFFFFFKLNFQVQCMTSAFVVSGSSFHQDLALTWFVLISLIPLRKPNLLAHMLYRNSVNLWRARLLPYIAFFTALHALGSHWLLTRSAVAGATFMNEFAPYAIQALPL